MNRFLAPIMLLATLAMSFPLQAFAGVEICDNGIDDDGDNNVDCDDEGCAAHSACTGTAASGSASASSSSSSSGAASASSSTSSISSSTAGSPAPKKKAKGCTGPGCTRKNPGMRGFIADGGSLASSSAIATLEHACTTAKQKKQFAYVQDGGNAYMYVSDKSFGCVNDNEGWSTYYAECVHKAVLGAVSTKTVKKMLEEHDEAVLKKVAEKYDEVIAGKLDKTAFEAWVVEYKAQVEVERQQLKTDILTEVDAKDASVVRSVTLAFTTADAELEEKLGARIAEVELIAAQADLRSRKNEHRGLWLLSRPTPHFAALGGVMGTFSQGATTNNLDDDTRDEFPEIMIHSPTSGGGYIDFEGGAGPGNTGFIGFGRVGFGFGRDAEGAMGQISLMGGAQVHLIGPVNLAAAGGYLYRRNGGNDVRKFSSDIHGVTADLRVRIDDFGMGKGASPALDIGLGFVHGEVCASVKECEPITAALLKVGGGFGTNARRYTPDPDLEPLPE